MANSISVPECLGSLTKHPKYYWETGDLHILADHTLFRVHSYFFARESPIFNRKLNPASPGETKEGATDTDPIVLENVPAEDFESFLWVFYNPKYSLYDANIEKWKCILDLANRWQFPQVKELAVRELHKKKELGLVEKMALYQHFQVHPKHLIPLYGLLCSRDTPLTIEEAVILGIPTTVFIQTAREQLRARPSSGCLSPLPEGLDEGGVHRKIQDLLGCEESSSLLTGEFNVQDADSPTTPGSKRSSIVLTNGNWTNGQKASAKRVPLSANSKSTSHR